MNKVAFMLKAAAKTIREQEEENSKLKSELLSFKTTEQYRKLANDMAEKGFVPYNEIDKKAQEMATQKIDIPVLKKAMELALEKRASLVRGVVDDIGTGKPDPLRQLYNTLLNTEEEE